MGEAMAAREFLPPMMSNGKTWADYGWWNGKAAHGATTAPTSFDEAAALTWSRCWAYIEEHNLPPEVCWHIWPIAYAALNACSRVTAYAEPAPTHPEADA